MGWRGELLQDNRRGDFEQQIPGDLPIGEGSVFERGEDRDVGGGGEFGR